MKHLLLLISIFVATGSIAAQDKNPVYHLDSVYTYYGNGELDRKKYYSYNKDNLNNGILTRSIDWNGYESDYTKESKFYNEKGNITLHNVYTWMGEWVHSAYTEYSWDENNRLASFEENTMDIILEKWYVSRKEVYTYDKDGSLIEIIHYNTAYDGTFGIDYKTVYSDFVTVDKPQKEEMLRYENGTYTPIVNTYNEYDGSYFLKTKTDYNINAGEETVRSKKEYAYNDRGEITEIVESYNWYSGELELYNKTEYIYNPVTYCLDSEKKYSFDSWGTQDWRFSGEDVYFWSEAVVPLPLADIDSHWNYWMATEYTYGFHKYTAVRDTVITAPMFETGELKTVTASLIHKTTSYSMHSYPVPTENDYMGYFATFREGNVSYVWEERNKQWFRWVDMNAKPGDKWVVPEIISGRGVYDYVEVSFLDTLEIDGKEIPCLYMIPSCTSRYSLQKDITSRISMSGYWNIDYWSIYGSPEPQANGFVNSSIGMTEVGFGLICAKLNDEYLVTDNLEEYVMYNNTPYYEQGIIDCDSLRAPMVGGYNGIKKLPFKVGLPMDAVYPRSYDLPLVSLGTLGSEPTVFEQYRNRKSTQLPEPTDMITIPVVVHIVHNPDTPEERIEQQQVKEMIDELNRAFSDTQLGKVRTPFKEIVGNPHMKFELAQQDPAGNPTDGIVYYETNVPYYDMPSWSDTKERYAFKFNDDGTSRNWNHSEYTNIYIVDLGGFDGEKNIGGFVTNPEYTNNEEYEVYKKWIMEGDPLFWDTWLKTEEASMLDGLTVDTWYTFGGKSGSNPHASFNTAIHELGHYFGLRHISMVILENRDGSFSINDDGFEDTPFTHYNQYDMLSCDQDIYQCGNLVQTENYMDYSLSCACMFTQEQSAFMRQFIASVRPAFLNGPVSIDGIATTDEVVVYPNPATSIVNIKGDYRSGSMFDMMGRKIKDITAGEQHLNIGDLNPGVYFIKFELESGKNTITKLIIN